MIHLPFPPNMLSRALLRVLEERARQNTKWGEQNHPNGTRGDFTTEADKARHATQVAASEGTVTWMHILREEFWEAMAETDPEKLKIELTHVAAVALQWIECIERHSEIPGH